MLLAKILRDFQGVITIHDHKSVYFAFSQIHIKEEDWVLFSVLQIKFSIHAVTLNWFFLIVRNFLLIFRGKLWWRVVFTFLSIWKHVVLLIYSLLVYELWLLLLLVLCIIKVIVTEAWNSLFFRSNSLTILHHFVWRNHEDSFLCFWIVSI